MNQETQKEIELSIIDKLVTNYSLQIEDIDKEKHTLKRDLRLDSLEVIEMCIYIETEFNINVPDEMWEDWANKTISEIALQVELLKQKK